jgi:hypothetical protein
MRTRNHGPDAGSHDTHDRLLVAAAAAGDLAGPELAGSETLLATCPDCRALHAELLAIAATTRHLPAPARPPTMDFRITPDRAAELARGGLWRRLLRPFGRPGRGTVRPLAAAFTTLGLAGLMLAALPSIQLGGSSAGASAGAYVNTALDSGMPEQAPAATAGPEIESPRDAAGGVPASGDTAAERTTGELFGSLAQPLPSTYADGTLPSFTSNTKGSGTATAPPTATAAPAPAGDRLAFAVSDGSGGPSPLVLLSLGLLAIGLGLFLLRRLALRLR